MERLLRMSEVAQRLGVPVATLKHWRHRGLGPQGARIGRRVMYRESDVERWVTEQFNVRKDPA